MQLVGATSGFIRGPFLRRSSSFGFLSGALAVGLLWSLLQFVEQQVEGVMSLLKLEQLAILGGGVLVVGVLVGFISTFAAIKKYMKMSLDELY